MRGIAVVLVLALGCFRTQNRDRDAGPDGGNDGSMDGSADGSLADGAAGDAMLDGACPMLGIYRSCGALCELDCPVARTNCSIAHQACIGEFTEERDPGGCRVSFPHTDGLNAFSSGCRGHKVCAGRSEEPPDADGACVDPSYCEAAAAHGVAHSYCFHHHDQSPYRGEAPAEECPPSTDDLTAFCGMSCPQECPFLRREDDRIPPIYRLEGDRAFDRMCVGVTEERAIGVCSVGSDVCYLPGTTFNNIEMEDYEAFYERPFACLLVHDRVRADVPYGFITTADACRAWVRRYPGAGECYDAAKNPIAP